MTIRLALTPGATTNPVSPVCEEIEAPLISNPTGALQNVLKKGVEQYSNSIEPISPAVVWLILKV